MKKPRQGAVRGDCPESERSKRSKSRLKSSRSTISGDLERQGTGAEREDSLVLLGFLLHVTDLLRDLLQSVFVVRVLNLQV